MISSLTRRLPAPPGKPIPPAEQADTFQKFTRELASGASPWTPETAAFVRALFDDLATDWDATKATGRDEPVRDALQRGGPLPTGLWLELGSGTGVYTASLAEHTTQVVSIDLSEQMLHQAAGRSPFRVRADAARLPVADGAASLVAAIDMLLFPHEIARVLRPDGVLLWINQLGTDGPLYLPTADVVSVLPGAWRGVEAMAGWGSWAAIRRA